MTNLSAEEKVYVFIRQYTADQGHPPTLREMSAGVYMAMGTIIRCLDKLEAQGRIARKHGKSRGITLLDD
jgi:repressor LexA